MIDGTSFNWALNNIIGFSALEWNECKSILFANNTTKWRENARRTKLEPIWMSIAVIAYDLWCWINLYFRFFYVESMLQLQVNEGKNHIIANGLNVKLKRKNYSNTNNCTFHLVFLTWFPCLIKHQRKRAKYKAVLLACGYFD